MEKTITEKEVNGMETIEKEVYQEQCPFCKRIFEALYKKQVSQWLEMHQEYCKMNPKNQENGKE